MATITDKVLTISHDHSKKLATVNVTCKVNFTPQELCLMKNCKDMQWFKLKCELWGADWPDPDDKLYTIGTVHYFPDPTPTATESRTFTVTVGQGVLDEDVFGDEIYGLLILTNLYTGAVVKKKTNEVHHHF